jgi:pimeloyl-ACP methyl ester carboxylesterase
MDDYAQWVIDQLRAIGEPVDLVGHDWGGILSARVAALAPQLLRSWVSDAAATLRPSYAWHDLALIWQTEGAGEEFWASMLADRAAAAQVMTGFALSIDDATAMCEAWDEQMVAAILALYRSADGIGTKWEIVGQVSAPGLLMVGADDPFGSVESAASMAKAIGVRSGILEGAGHFWPLQAPAAGAAMLQRFWSELDE